MRIVGSEKELLGNSETDCAKCARSLLGRSVRRERRVYELID